MIVFPCVPANWNTLVEIGEEHKMILKTLHSFFWPKSTKTQVQEIWSKRQRKKIQTTSKAKRGSGTTVALSSPLSHVKVAFWLLIWRKS